MCSRSTTNTTRLRNGEGQYYNAIERERERERECHVTILFAVFFFCKMLNETYILHFVSPPLLPP